MLVHKMRLAAALALWASSAHAETKSYTFDLRNWVVDYQRATIEPRKQPYELSWDVKWDAMLANDVFPGPIVEAYEGDSIEVTVLNNLLDSQVEINWHGLQVKTSPPKPLLQQGGTFKYELTATKAGTYFWEASKPLQAAAGLKGVIVVRSKDDANVGKYQEDRVVVLADAHSRPEVCIDAAGQLIAGCPEVDKMTIDGQWGDGSKNLPKPVLQVAQGKCHRMRFFGLTSIKRPFFKVAIQDHTVEILGQGSQPTFEVHSDAVTDLVLCADQKPGIFSSDFDININYGDRDFTATLRYTKSEEQDAAPEAATAQLKAAEPAAAFNTMEHLSADFDRTTCDKDYVFDLREQVVDYLRPTIDMPSSKRKPPAEIPVQVRKQALLVNNTYPGPTIEATEGDMICVTVLNNLGSDPVAIHWHGQHMRGFPAFDGVYGVHQGAINPSESFTYRWRANSGTAIYHAHMQALQADKGLKGAIVIHPKEDPYKHMYDEDRVVAISDEWKNPGACLRNEGAQPGNPVCAEIDKLTWNGQWGDGSDDYPWPTLEVEQGKCYRYRFVGIMGQAQNFLMTMAGHDMTIIAIDGAEVEPTKVSMFNLHAGERVDVVVCANQAPGNYLVSAVYDLATFLETAPAPKLPRVDSSKFWAFIHYKGHNEKPGKATKKLLGGYNAPPGTGGGAKPGPVAGFPWNTNERSSWTKIRNVGKFNVTEPEEADVVYTLDVGVEHPSYSAGKPYGSTDRMYMFTNITSWKKPSTPLLHTKGQCGAEGVPYINVPETAKTVEVRINNLSPTAHVLHMHGMRFSVINYAPYSETWCAAAHFECFFLPISAAKIADCPGARLGDEDKDGPGSEYWGCPYKPDTDVKLQNLQNPLQKDMISLWRRSWAVIRFKVDNPGIWLFHCHMEQHIPTGQIMAFNLLPSQQPAIPKDVPTEGPCPVWSGGMAAARRKGPGFDVFV
eukprot:TRINITY_DN121201_c0_g1_i1.p1 TRINITY_DN121201_c0_g1~~TRINITY_DN121201_c0_g1_i1.p1  ORF type:complete len:952 (-),score=240.67 TRINITY_DN121201_c0_g1_i1:304-3159(-)